MNPLLGSNVSVKLPSYVGSIGYIRLNTGSDTVKLCEVQILGAPAPSVDIGLTSSCLNIIPVPKSKTNIYSMLLSLAAMRP